MELISPTTVDFLSALVFAGSLGAGFLGSLTGLGGGVVIVPLLTLMFGIDLRYAIGASLVSVIATSSGAAAAYVREDIPTSVWDCSSRSPQASARFWGRGSPRTFRRRRSPLYLAPFCCIRQSPRTELPRIPKRVNTAIPSARDCGST